ncbi:MAG: hypothetical protein R2706_03210 [Acidimicrobiales bacterium]
MSASSDVNRASLHGVLNTVLLAQIDVAADNLDLVICALLIIALLLALLTFWYWRHTKPRPVVIEPKIAAPVPEAKADDASVLERALADDYDPDSVWADSPSPASNPIRGVGPRLVAVCWFAGDSLGWGFPPGVVDDDPESNDRRRVVGDYGA